jgi:inosose dehydratase
MAIERSRHVDRVMTSSDLELCLDTGHLLLGGADPVEVARRAPERPGEGPVADAHLSVEFLESLAPV